MGDRNNITGFVLAGGKSSRMGKDKGLMLMNGTTMIEHSIRALTPLCTSIIIIANNNNYKNLGYQVYSDNIKDSGPLSGICTGLSLTKTNINFFTTCDSPFVNSELLSVLIKQQLVN